jgi:hypothetical protein
MPWAPSTVTRAPSGMRRVATFVPTTAAIAYSRAAIAVC